MKYCCECGKKLRCFEGYIHPILGKKNLVCYKCLNHINISMEFYKNCLFNGRQDHKKECYFWDSKKKKCRNEKYFKDFNRTGTVAFKKILLPPQERTNLLLF